MNTGRKPIKIDPKVLPTDLPSVDFDVDGLSEATTETTETGATESTEPTASITIESDTLTFGVSSSQNPFANPPKTSQNPFANTSNPFANTSNPFANTSNPFAQPPSGLKKRVPLPTISESSEESSVFNFSAPSASSDGSLSTEGFSNAFKKAADNFVKWAPTIGLKMTPSGSKFFVKPTDKVITKMRAYIDHHQFTQNGSSIASQEVFNKWYSTFGSKYEVLKNAPAAPIVPKIITSTPPDAPIVPENYRTKILDILSKSDLDMVTTKSVREKLEAETGIDFSSQRKEMNKYISDLYDKVVAERGNMMGETIDTVPAQIVQEPTRYYGDSPDSPRPRPPRNTPTGLFPTPNFVTVPLHQTVTEVVGYQVIQYTNSVGRQDFHLLKEFKNLEAAKKFAKITAEKYLKEFTKKNYSYQWGKYVDLVQAVYDSAGNSFFGGYETVRRLENEVAAYSFNDGIDKVVFGVTALTQTSTKRITEAKTATPVKTVQSVTKTYQLIKYNFSNPTKVKILTGGVSKSEATRLAKQKAEAQLPLSQYLLITESERDGEGRSYFRANPSPIILDGEVVAFTVGDGSQFDIYSVIEVSIPTGVKKIGGRKKSAKKAPKKSAKKTEYVEFSCALDSDSEIQCKPKKASPKKSGKKSGKKAAPKSGKKSGKKAAPKKSGKKSGKKASPKKSGKKSGKKAAPKKSGKKSSK